MQLKTQFDKVLQFSQCIENPKTEDNLHQWERSKRLLRHKFLNDEMRYTHPEPVTFTLDTQGQQTRYNCFIDTVAQWVNWQDNIMNFLNHITAKEFYSNTLAKDYWVTPDKKIQAGAKIIKALKHFNLDAKLLREIQNKASELIQENKVTGYLTFSVHPLDFLSLSENTFNWRSCHALDGDYRTGNLSYMGDSSTMICYLASEEQVRLPNFPPDVLWNSKKWRCLLHFNTELTMVFAGRQYPFTSMPALDLVRQVFYNNLVPADCYNYWSHAAHRPEWSHWHNDYINAFEYAHHGHDDNMDLVQDNFFVANGKIWDLHHVMQDAPNSLHFNDVLRSSCYTQPYYMYQKSWGGPGELKFEIGSEVSCIHCGDHTILRDGEMLCDYCRDDDDGEGYSYCDCCDTRFYEDEGYWVDDTWICPHCYAEYTFTCERCGMRTFNEQKVYHIETQKWICKDCMEEIEDGKRDNCESNNR